MGEHVGKLSPVNEQAEREAHAEVIQGVKDALADITYPRSSQRQVLEALDSIHISVLRTGGVP